MEEGEVAEKKRRGEDPADENLDEMLDDAVEEEPASGSGGTATRTRTKASTDRPAKQKKPGLFALVFGRIGRFFREVVAELRKVIWPTRKELLTYTSVVIVFVSIMVALVALLDYAFAKGALAVFGGGGSE